MTPTAIKEGSVIEQPADEIWVRSGDNVGLLAKQILERFDGTEPHIGYVDLACIGAGCVNQAVKSIAAARVEAQKDEYDLMTEPYFSSIVDEEGRERTRMMLRVVCVPLGSAVHGAFEYVPHEPK